MAMGLSGSPKSMSSGVWVTAHAIAGGVTGNRILPATGAYGRRLSLQPLSGGGGSIRLGLPPG
eukprot:2496705-Amphidinium_carterae.1